MISLSVARTVAADPASVALLLVGTAPLGVAVSPAVRSTVGFAATVTVGELASGRLGVIGDRHAGTDVDVALWCDSSAVAEVEAVVTAYLRDLAHAAEARASAA